MDGRNGQGKPLQILDFKTFEGKKMLVLKDENLESILKRVEDLPVALISITGSSRQGKSFLLSFMIRYLEALKIDESDWMGWDNSKEALVGFSWRDGIDPETSGMWLWSEPFIVESNDEKVAILLMDTQGTFDEFTTPREWSTIVGLSMLMSSCMIFNCQANIQEDILNTLETYVQYGIQALVQNEMEEQRPFQKLLFLVRDWRMASQFAYGSKGGSLYLKEKLSLKDNQSEQAQRVRKSIKNCFETIDCFLMPDPGEKAKAIDFNGAIDQLSSQYAKKIESFVTDLLNPDDIMKKTVFGVDANGQDVFNYFTKYVEIFNGDELPDPICLYSATVQINNEILVRKAKKMYLENMKKKFRGSSFLSEKKFQAFHKESEKKSTEEFKKGKKLGDEVVISMCEEVFQEEISKEFKSLQMQNKNKREKGISSAMDVAISSYKEKMEDEFLEQDFIDDKKLLTFSEKFINESVIDFEEKVEEDEEVMEKLVENLKGKLASEETNFQDRNKLKRSEAEQVLTSLADDIIKNHCRMLKEKFEVDEMFTKEQLQDIHTAVQEKSLQVYNQAEKKGDRNFMSKFKKLFEEGLEAKTQDTIKEFLNQQQQNILGAENLMSELVNQFKEKLTVDSDVVDNEDDLREKRKEYEEEAVKTYKEKHGFATFNQTVSKLGEELNLKLTKVFEEDVIEKYQLKLKESEASFVKAFTEALVSYNKEMETFVKTCEFHQEDDLKAHHQKSEAIALDTYNKSPKFGKNREEKDAEMLGKLETELKGFLQKNLEKNASKKCHLEQKSKNDVTECVKEYNTDMKTKLDLARDEESLKEFHLTALDKAKKSFRERCVLKTNEEFLHQYCRDIEDEIGETFEEILELFQLKSEEQSVATEKALIDARRFYREEMDKHYSNKKFMRPIDMEKLHEDVSKKSIERCSEATPLTALQKDDLQAYLHRTFKEYEDTNKMNFPVDPAIGIDLGTTYSCVAVYYQGDVHVIPNKEGRKTTPSYVAFRDGIEIVGDAAKNQAHENPENTIFDAKRIIGRRMDDEKLQSDMKLWPFKVVEEGGLTKVVADGRTYYPEQISAKVLQEMRANAESFLGLTVTRAVITVPAYFTDGQRKATMDAGEIAGFTDIKIIDEPTAAALAFKLQYNDNDSRNVLIFDLGGGTFDVAVLEMRRGEIEVKAKDGDTHLGGEDFDNNLVEHCALEFQSLKGVDILEGRNSSNVAIKRKCLKALRRLRNESERRKIDLATARTVDIVVDSIESGQDLKVRITREQFERMNEDLFEETIDIVERVLQSAGKDKSSIDDIVLVGGSTRIPKVQQLLVEFFDGKALSKRINPDEAVAIGAAYQAAIWNGEIAKGSKDFNAILDITPYSMGVEVYGGDFSVIIPKNNRIPCKIEDTYRTAHNNQTSVQIVVYQGEKTKAIDNQKLGEFYLNGIPPADAGREVVKVIMSITDQGVLEVTAACCGNGTSKTGLTVNEQRWRLGRDQINKILAEGKI